MCGPILLMLVGLPALEIYGILKVGQWVGAFETMLLLATAFMLGLGLIRGHSLAALRRIQMGAPPSPDVLAGPLVFVAAVLLMVPGFFSDLVALPLLLPPVRRLVARMIVRRFGRPGGPGGPDGQGPFGGAGGSFIVIRRG
jgi:UPF0716 protein FxsA